MLTLSFGFKKPETGDKGSVFFPALEDNIQQTNDHDHNGTNSKKLTAQSITGVAEDILAAGWVSLGGGNYRQLVNMPAGTVFDDYSMAFQIKNGPAAGHRINPSIEKVTVNTYYVYVNDNTIDLRILYLV
jgi:hypothetical protein